jgi:hypothetical protein
MLILKCLIILGGRLWIYLNTLAILCLFLDSELKPIQRWGQTIIVIVFPYLGASFILLLVNEHSPTVIQRFYVPWPFKKLILNKPRGTGGSGHNGEEMPGGHSG